MDPGDGSPVPAVGTRAASRSQPPIAAWQGPPHQRRCRHPWHRALGSRLWRQWAQSARLWPSGTQEGPAHRRLFVSQVRAGPRYPRCLLVPAQVTSTWCTFGHRPLTHRCVVVTTKCQVPPAVVLSQVCVGPTTQWISDWFPERTGEHRVVWRDSRPAGELGKSDGSPQQTGGQPKWHSPCNRTADYAAQGDRVVGINWRLCPVRQLGERGTSLGGVAGRPVSSSGRCGSRSGNAPCRSRRRFCSRAGATSFPGRAVRRCIGDVPRQVAGDGAGVHFGRTRRILSRLPTALGGIRLLPAGAVRFRGLQG